MKKIGLILMLLVCISFKNDKNRLVEIAICMDMSASTNGLLDHVRNHFWEVINEFRIKNPETDMKIAVVGFARPSFKRSNDYVKVLSNLTDDYDYVASQLNSLHGMIEKGDQFVGSALKTTIRLNWSAGAKKMIFLYGNGRVDLGSVDYHDACDLAIKKQITIHTVYCIQRSIITKEISKWKAVAEATGGEFNTFLIQPKLRPQKFSAEANWLVDMNIKMLGTHIYFTPQGKEADDRMRDADQKAFIAGEDAFYSRCLYKTSPHFEARTGTWDLVGLMKNNPPDSGKINPEYLPREFKNLSMDELKNTVLQKDEMRRLLSAQIKNNFEHIKLGCRMESPLDSIFLSCINMKL